MKRTSRDQVSLIVSNLVRVYLSNTGPQGLGETSWAIMLIKRLLLSDVGDDAIILLADSLKNIILSRGLPNCLSFEVTLRTDLESAFIVPSIQFG